MTPESAPILVARRRLGLHRCGTLSWGDRFTPARFVVDPESGRLVMPLEPGVLEAFEHVLHIPDLTGSVAEILLTPERTDRATDAACDRWLAYHLKTEHRTWVKCRIDAVKVDGWVVDGCALEFPNPLRVIESVLLRKLNGNRERLARLVVLPSDETSALLAVGVDPLGIDMRARFGIVRHEFADECPVAEAATAAIENLLREES